MRAVVDAGAERSDPSHDPATAEQKPGNIHMGITYNFTNYTFRNKTLVL